MPNVFLLFHFLYLSHAQCYISTVISHNVWRVLEVTDRREVIWTEHERNIVRSRELASYARPLGPSIGGGR